MDKFIKYNPVSSFPKTVGSAIQFGMSVKKSGEIVGTVEIAPQVKEKPPAGSSESPFDWTKKLFMQLDVLELGKLLSVLNGRSGKQQVIHKSPMSGKPEEQTTSNVELTRNEETGDIAVSFQQKKPGDEKFARLGLYLKLEDAEILSILFTEIIKHAYKTSEVQSFKGTKKPKPPAEPPDEVIHY